MDWDVVIGLEVHAELNTNSKVFCSCKNEYGSAPNTNCCPVCIGLPGALPVLNKQAVKYTIKAGLALACNINDIAIMERKNYFYPDLSKAYQISQLVKPICLNGGIKLSNGKFVRLNRIHLEEDAGKLIHNENIGSLIDYNRGGVPLIEIVTEPDISSADEAVEFVTKLRNTLIYTGVAQCKMEEGGMRCDVNLSIKPKGSKTFGTRTEMKNLNSFKMIERAIKVETERQIDLIESGGKVVQETRRWDDVNEETVAMRSKETSQDYRYFPDPDILAVTISRQDVEDIRKTLPLLPEQLKDKFVNEYNLPEYDADVIIKDKKISTFYLKCVELLNEPKQISNWLMTNVLAKLKDDTLQITPKQLTDIISLVLNRKISKQNGVELFELIWGTTDDALKIATNKKMINDMSADELYKIIDEILVNNPQVIPQYKTEPDKILNFLTGQTMRQTKGKADSKLVREYLINKLK